MAMRHRTGADGPPLGRPGERDASFGVLFRRLGDDTAALVRHEFQLARLEVRDTLETMARQLVWLAVAAILAVGGALALTAFLILLVGLWLGGVYWASALIVGVVFLLVGGALAARAVRKMKEEDLKPDQTLDTLRDDAAWARREARDFRREITS